MLEAEIHSSYSQKKIALYMLNDQPKVSLVEETGDEACQESPHTLVVDEAWLTTQTSRHGSTALLTGSDQTLDAFSVSRYKNSLGGSD